MDQICAYRVEVKGQSDTGDLVKRSPLELVIMRASTTVTLFTFRNSATATRAAYAVGCQVFGRDGYGRVRVPRLRLTSSAKALVCTVLCTTHDEPGKPPQVFANRNGRFAAVSSRNRQHQT